MYVEKWEKHIPRCWPVTLINYNLFLSLLQIVNDFVKTELLFMSDLSIDLHSSLMIEHLLYFILIYFFHLLYFNFEKFLSCGATYIQVVQKSVKQKDKIGRDAKKKTPFHIKFHK